MRPTIELENRARAAAQRQLDAYNARDVDAFVAAYAEDVEVRDLRKGELMGRGRAYLRQTYGALFERSPRLAAHVVSRQVTGDVVFDHELVEGLRDGVVHATAIYRVDDEGLIARVWFVVAEPGD